MDKKSYLRQYPLEKLCWDGTLAKPLVFTSSSGSTGEPFYFPRGHELDWQYSLIAELFLENTSRTGNGPTLVIVGFGMGVWIGGLITYKAFEIASQRTGLPISIITPGINKDEIFHAFKKLSPQFKETILIGYPPFLKDVIDEALSQGINLKKLNLRIFSAAEAYTEKFRDHLAKKLSIKNIPRDFLNIYGTADIGAMAWETPTSILIRRLATKNKKLFKNLFGSIHKTPTLAQYNPLFITFESVDGRLLLTGNNSIPLIRYAVGDHGGVFTFDEANATLRETGIDLAKHTATGQTPKPYELPFVHVYERVDFAVKLHLRDIYPETIKDVLINKKFNKVLTGKFTITTKYNKEHNQYLEVNLELLKNKGISKSVKKRLHQKLLESLRDKTNGPGDPKEFIKRKGLLELVFWPYSHPLHFRTGIKQKWSKKNV